MVNYCNILNYYNTLVETGWVLQNTRDIGEGSGIVRRRTDGKGCNLITKYEEGTRHLMRKKPNKADRRSKRYRTIVKQILNTNVAILTDYKLHDKKSYCQIEVQLKGYNAHTYLYNGLKWIKLVCISPFFLQSKLTIAAIFVS